MPRFRGPRALLPLLALSGLLLGSVPAPCVGEDAVAALRPLVRPGEQAPSFTLDRLDGKPVAFVPGGGIPSLVVFWSAFCPLCREVMPDLASLSNRYGKEVRFLTVNLDGYRFKNAIRSFLKENGAGFPVLLDDIRNDFFVASDPYGITKTPTAVLVDADGIVRSAYSAGTIRELIRDFDQVISSVRRRSSRLRAAERP